MIRRGVIFAWLLALGSLHCQKQLTPLRVPVRPSAPAQNEPSGAARLQRAQQRFAMSAYTAAEADFRALLVGPERPQAALGLAEVLLTTGRYADGLSVLALVEREPSVHESATLWKARILTRQGALAAAEALLASIDQRADAREARLEHAEVLLALGRRQDAEPLLTALVDDYNEDRVASGDGLGLAITGRAAALLGSPRDANDLYGAAERAAPSEARALLYRVELFLDKYDPGHAEEVLNEVLSRAPQEPDALVGLARVKLAQALDFDAAERLARLALGVNPALASAHAILVSVALRDLDLDLAAQRVADGLSKSPGDLGLLSLKATGRFLADDTAGFVAAKKAVFAQNSQYSKLYAVLGEFADWEHRYDEIVAMMREAVALNGDDATAYAELGLNLIRAGHDTTGVQALSRAFALDPYNVRVFNTLNLYDKVIPKDYVSVEHPPFRIRYRRDEKDILERYVPQLLARAYQTFLKNYGFTPETPIGIELYAERENFGIRTGGLPETAIQGVCFGRTIAAMSPKNESFNLGMTLWHELSHVFHLQLSRSRVPRWFTEGLAEYETITARPEWAREQDPDLYQALRAGKVPEVEHMTQAFTRADDLRDVATAYYASSQILAMLAGSHGSLKMAEMLRLWGQGKRTPEVMQLALGESATDIDRKFKSFAAARLARYDTQFMPMTGSPRPDLARSEAQHFPKDPARLTAYGLALLRAGKSAEAKAELERALALDPKFADARFILAELGSASDPKASLSTLRALIADGHDGYAVEMLIARLLADRGEEALARVAMEMAARFDPSQAAPQYALADLAEKVGDTERELESLRVLARLEQHEPKVYVRLLRRLNARSAYAEAVEVGESAIYADVSGLWTHALFAEALAHTGNRERARYELESALLCDGSPEELGDVHARLAELLRSMGKPRDAKRHDAAAHAAGTPTAPP